MSIEEARRLELVRDLLAMKNPLDDVIRQLSAMRWDYEGDGVELRMEHIANALQRYLRDEVSASGIEVWANQIEGRDDVWIESGAEHEIEEVLHELANPLLTQVLSPIRARELAKRLGPNRQ